MGTITRLLAFVAMALLCAACSAKKLWGVDVDSKEDKGEFESLLAKAYGASSTGQNEFLETLSMLAGTDMSSLSLSELSTRMIDAVVEVIQDDEWVAQFSEPGVIRRIIQNGGAEALLTDETFASPERDDWLELLALEESPILYKTKFLELREKAVGRLVMFRMSVADPVKLNGIIRDYLRSFGVDEDSIKEILEIANNPQLLFKQLQDILSDPETMEELSSLVDMLMGGDPLGSFQDLYDDEVNELLKSMQENPEELEKLYAELLEDPALAESARTLRDHLGGSGGVEAEGILRQEL